VDFLEAAKEPITRSFDLDASHVAHRSTVSSDGGETLDLTTASRLRSSDAASPDPLAPCLGAVHPQAIDVPVGNEHRSRDQAGVD